MATVSRREMKLQAKQQISGKILSLFVIELVVSLILMLFGGFGAIQRIRPWALAEGLERTGSIPFSLWVSIATILGAVFAVGLARIYVRLVKYGDNPVLKDAFWGFSIFGKSVWLAILTNILITLWTLLLIIPGIIKSYAYSMSQYILAENPDMAARETITMSKHIMRGHKFELFILQVSFFWWYLVGVLTCGLAFIYVSPYYRATMANFYMNIKQTNA